MGTRLLYFDVLKAFAIFTVVWGHCLLNMTTARDYWLQDDASQFILSFHMPLFMMVSGYFAYSSIFKENIFGVVKNRFIQLIVPSVVWGILVSGIALIVHRGFTVQKVLFILQNTVFSYWFVKALFFCYVLLMIFVALFRRSHVVSYLFVLVVAALADHLDYCSSMSMLPYFLMGILLHHFKNRVRHKRMIGILAAIIYAGCILHWSSSDYNMYVHPFSYTEITQFALRTVIGISGSLTIMFLVQMVYVGLSETCRIRVAEVGQMTLGIYFIQLIFAEAGNKMIAPNWNCHTANCPPPTRDLIYDLVITPLASFAILLICVCIIKVIRKNALAKLLLLGEK